MFLAKALLVYLISSIPTGVFIPKLFGLDLTKSGSGNIGTSNSYRVGGAKLAILISFFDILKGFLSSYFLLSGSNYAFLIPCLGQIFPIFNYFKGGKGIGTFIGSLIGFSNIGIIYAMIWGIFTYLFKMPFLSSFLIIFMAFFLIPVCWQNLLLISIFIYKHKSNIMAFLRGINA
jgi:acyl phosphate:glycerol-3-phosphate acyltransferase